MADEAAERPAEAERAEGRRQSVVDEADAQLGVPYVYGGTTPSASTAPGSPAGCSPRRSASRVRAPPPSRARSATAVSLDELAPRRPSVLGQRHGVYHVGIYAGDGEYIHASTGGGRVMRATFDYFAPAFAKRVIE